VAPRRRSLKAMACVCCGFPAKISPAPGLFVCLACCARIFGLLRFVPTTALADIWTFADSSGSSGTTQTVIPKDGFDEQVGKKASVVTTQEDELSNAQAHLDLATAYVEMGLLLDAAREAGWLLGTALSKPDFVTGAIRLLLTPPLLKKGGLAALTFRIRAQNVRLN